MLRKDGGLPSPSEAGKIGFKQEMHDIHHFKPLYTAEI